MSSFAVEAKMVDLTALYKPINHPELKPWEIAYNRLQVLIKTEILNHHRIREHILELKERYSDGEMGDGAPNWEKWAIEHFAGSSRHLDSLSSPHPLQMDKWEAQRLRTEQRARKRAAAEDRKRAQKAWDQWRQENPRRGR
jgi:hypothetical protein